MTPSVGANDYKGAARSGNSNRGHEKNVKKDNRLPCGDPHPLKTDKPRPYVCATCSRTFARSEHLKRHKLSHTKEKPFKCPQCARCFARRDLVVRHRQKLHSSAELSSSRTSSRYDRCTAGNDGMLFKDKALTNVIVDEFDATSAYEDFGGNLNNLFFGAVDSAHAHFKDATLSPIVGGPHSPHHGAFPGTSENEVAMMDDSDMDWMNGFDNHMSSNSANEQSVVQSSSSALSGTSPSVYGEVMVYGSSNHAQKSAVMWQSSATSPARREPSPSLHISRQAFQDNMIVFDALSSTSSSKQYHHPTQTNFSSLPCFALKSTPETELLAKRDSQSSHVTASEKSQKNMYPAILKILHGPDTHCTLLKLKENTRSSIEKQAKEYIVARIAPAKPTVCIWYSHLLSVVVDKAETDISSFEDDDLTFLLHVLSQHTISQFTVEVSCTDP